MKQALQALDLIEKDIEWHDKSPTRKFCNQAAHFLRQAIEQAEKQEPTLWFAIGEDGHVKYTTDSDRALKWKQAGSYRLVRNYYTAPPKREWVNLSDEEFEEILKELSHDPRLLAVEIEARLTEKNI